METSVTGAMVIAICRKYLATRVAVLAARVLLLLLIGLLVFIAAIHGLLGLSHERI